jgi:hypothetical protein
MAIGTASNEANDDATNLLIAQLLQEDLELVQDYHQAQQLQLDLCLSNSSFQPNSIPIGSNKSEGEDDEMMALRLTMESIASSLSESLVASINSNLTQEADDMEYAKRLQSEVEVDYEFAKSLQEKDKAGYDIDGKQFSKNDIANVEVCLGIGRLACGPVSILTSCLNF